MHDKWQTRNVTKVIAALFDLPFELNDLIECRACQLDRKGNLLLEVVAVATKRVPILLRVGDEL